MFRKVFLLLLVVVFLVGAAESRATLSRIETLGQQGLYLMDDTNVFDNPATINFYRDCLFIHMGGDMPAGVGGDLSAVGAISFALGDSLTLGLVAGGPGAMVLVNQGSITAIKYDAVDFMNNLFIDPLGVYPGVPNRTYPPNKVESDWKNPFQVILGYKMRNIKLGLAYISMTGAYEFQDNVNGIEWEQYSNLHIFQLGMSMNMGKLQPEAWLHFAPYWIRSDYTNRAADYESQQQLEGGKFVLGGRLFYNMSENLKVVPAITWEHVTGEVETDTDPDVWLTLDGLNYFPEDEINHEYLVDDFQVGVNMQYTEGGFFGLLVTGSLGLKYSRWERKIEVDYRDTDYEQTTGLAEMPIPGLPKASKYFAAPVAALGIEYWTNPTFCFRGGLSTTSVWAASLIEDEKTDTAGNKTTDESAMKTVQKTQAAVGMGLHFGNMLIDATFGNWFLVGEDGGNPAMGGSGPNLFSHLDVKYKW